VLREDLANDPEILHSFAGEAKLLASLAHANIVRFYSFEHKGSLAFIVMDYVEGATLRQQIRSARGRPLPLETATSVVRQVCAALHYAHAEGVIHRDVKPSNIILCPDGQVLLSDFGIAHAIGAGGTGVLEAGSPAYMSPEQFRGETLDARTDIYSLSLVIYEMLTGRKPFRGDTPGARGNHKERVRWEHLHAEPLPFRQFNSALPAGIASLITRSLAKDPAIRPPTTMDFWHRWQVAVPDQSPAQKPMFSEPAGARESQQAIPRVPLVRQDRLKFDRRVIAASITVSVVVVIVGLLITALSVQQSPRLSVPQAVTSVHPAEIGTGVRLKAGTIRVDQCFTHVAAVGIRSIFCVEQVTVTSTGNLKFEVSWTGQYVDENYQLKKGSDTGNKNMYLTDNLSNRYDHLDTGGATAEEVVLRHKQPVFGWFLFPPPVSGATMFTFHDDDLGRSISDINLAQ
jgi:serine/threonine protein kinase